MRQESRELLAARLARFFPRIARYHGSVAPRLRCNVPGCNPQKNEAHFQDPFEAAEQWLADYLGGGRNVCQQKRV